MRKWEVVEDYYNISNVTSLPSTFQPIIEADIDALVQAFIQASKSTIKPSIIHDELRRKKRFE